MYRYVILGFHSYKIIQNHVYIGLSSSRMDNKLCLIQGGLLSRERLKQLNFTEAVAVLARRAFTIKSVVFASACAGRARFCGAFGEQSQTCSLAFLASYSHCVITGVYTRPVTNFAPDSSVPELPVFISVDCGSQSDFARKHTFHRLSIKQLLTVNFDCQLASKSCLIFSAMPSSLVRSTTLSSLKAASFCPSNLGTTCTCKWNMS